MRSIAVMSHVGILFMDSEQPRRIRFHGKASVSSEDDLLADYPEAELIVWVNCPR